MTNPHAPPQSTQLAWKRCFAIGVFSAALACAAQTQPIVDVQNWQPGQLAAQVLQSDPHNEVRKLLHQAKYPQALLLVNKGLVTNPRDPQMQFWQGFIFEQLGQPKMALQVYLALTQEYPELPEPHNNLGVLYAAQGDYEKAKTALDTALRANPNYATAHENMGDILLNMARQSYERALAINPSQRDAMKKIERLKPALTATQTQP